MQAAAVPTVTLPREPGLPSATLLRTRRPSPYGLSVAALLDGDWLHMKGTVDLPDHAVLRITLSAQRLDVMHDRRESVLGWTHRIAETQSAQVEGRRFEASVRVEWRGHYRLTIEYSVFDQTEVDVVRSLGLHYRDWSQSWPVIVGDAHEIARALESDTREARELLVRLDDALARMQTEVALDATAQNWTRIREVLRSIERDARDRLSVAAATRRVILDACERIDACGPERKRLEYPPGITEADYIAEGCRDIPSGVNLQWDVQLAHAYVRRAGECLLRERLLLPLSIASDCWEAALDDPDGQPAVNWQVARDAALATADDRVRRVIEKMELATRAGDEARDERDRLVRELGRIPEP